MQKILDDLSKLSTQITEAEKNVAVLEARRKDTLSKLEEEGIKSIEAGQKFVQESEAELVKLENLIQSKYKKLKEDFDW